MRTIVLGWINKDPTSVNYNKGRAATWLYEGKSEDLRQARQYAVAKRCCVFVFRVDDSRDVLQLVREAMASGQFEPLTN